MMPPPIIELMIERAASTTENPTGPSYYIKASFPPISSGSTYDPP